MIMNHERIFAAYRGHFCLIATTLLFVTTLSQVNVILDVSGWIQQRPHQQHSPLIPQQRSLSIVRQNTFQSNGSPRHQLQREQSSISIETATLAKTTTTQLYFDGRNINDSNNPWEIYPINELHTKLRDAIKKEDYLTAGQISDDLLRRLYSSNSNGKSNVSRDFLSTLSLEQRKVLRKSLSWIGLGSVPWLIQRLDAFNYTFPTTIQINAFSAVNAILQQQQHVLEIDGTAAATTILTLEERVRNSDQNNSNKSLSNKSDNESRDESNSHIDVPKDLGVVISGATGSGKTLAYVVPMLSILSESLFLRQRLRISDEESIGDTTGDLVDRINIVTAPRVVSGGSNNGNTIKKGSTIATGAAIATLGRSGTDVKTPLALIVVPTRELGSQIAYIIYQLVGGASTTLAQARDYIGPKGVRIGCVLDDEDALFGLKLQTDIAITTPQYITKLLRDGDINPSKLRVIAYDEADLALEQTLASDLNILFNDDKEERMFTRLSFLVGASVTEALGNLAVSSRILPAGYSYIATATNFSPLLPARNNTIGNATVHDIVVSNTPITEQIVGTRPKTASLQDLGVCMYPGLTHERVVVKSKDGDYRLLILTRLIRQELQKFEKDVATDSSIQRPRVVVFFPDEVKAKEAIVPLRDALWGDHKLCVLLPTIGFSPMTIMDQFKRNETSVMLATPNAIRGLDFPALTHCYTLYLPIDDPREYIHLAGRVGRVGHQTKGRVISILNEDEAYQMDDLAKQLNFTFSDILAPTAESLLARSEDGTIDENAIDYEKLRRAFEDTISFVTTVDEPAIDPTKTIPSSIDIDYGNDDDDDDDDEDDDELTEFQ